MKGNQTIIAEYAEKVHTDEAFYRSNFELNASMAEFIATDILCYKNQTDWSYMSDMVKDRPFLIFRFSESGCKPCNFDLLTQIQTTLSDYSSFVRMFHSVNTERELLMFKNTYNIILPLYLIPSKPFDWIAEKENVPFFFVLHPNMKISHVYVPNKDFPEQNKLYLESVIRFLEQKRVLLIDDSFDTYLTATSV